MIYRIKNASFSLRTLTNLPRMLFNMTAAVSFKPSRLYLSFTLALFSIAFTSLSSQLFAKNLDSTYSGINEVEAISLQRNGLDHLLNYMDQRSDIFNRVDNKTAILSRKQKDDALDVWVLFLDYMSSLQQISDDSKGYLKLTPLQRNQREKIQLLAFNAHYRFGLEFIGRVQNDPELVKWYNKTHQSEGLSKNLYRKFNSQLLSDWTTDLFDDSNRLFGKSNSNNTHEIDLLLTEDREAIDSINRASLLTSNSISIFKRAFSKTWFPLQKGVARGMGKVKVWRIGETLIKPEQALAFSEDFEPGDFILTRKEWRLTNMGIPGYWTHSAMYIGTPSERKNYFDAPEIYAWLESIGVSDFNFDTALINASAIYSEHPGYDDLGDIRVIEALDAGVIFNSIETSLSADGAVIFRPKVSRLEKAKALYNAFFYTGQPYDFNFDFDSDNALVCTELIFKAYLPSTEQQGVNFPLNRVAGRKMLTPSEIAQWYEATVNTPDQELDLVMFIDNNEKEGVAYKSTAEAFIGTWARSDWRVLNQPERSPLEEQITFLGAENLLAQ